MMYRLCVPWLLALLARLVLVGTVHAPTILSDEVDYYLAARKPEHHPGILSLRYPPGYPLMLTPVARIGSREQGYRYSLLLNAAVSSLIVPLTWPLWSRYGIVGGVIVGLLSPGVVTSALLLSENLFAILASIWLICAVKYRERDSLILALTLGLTASLSALTRAAGGATVLATLLVLLLERRKKPLHVSFSLFAAATAPLIVFFCLRHAATVEAFNDPLNAAHPPELHRMFLASLHDLTSGTALESYAHRFPYAPVFVCIWFIYWLLQYSIYLLLGTAGLPLLLLHPRNRSDGTVRRFLLPLAAMTLFLLLLSANHNLAGRQSEQFVRGRYVEPLMPLWMAISLAAYASIRSSNISWRFLPLACTTSILAITASQNRAGDILLPLRSFIMYADPSLRAVLNAALCIILFVILRLWLQAVANRRFAATILLILVLIGAGMSTLRFRQQHRIAYDDSRIARWLAANDPSAIVHIVPSDSSQASVKISGLAWVAQEIRFFSPNRLVSEPLASLGGYRLSDGTGESAVLCTNPSPGRSGIVCLIKGGWIKR